MRLGIAQRFDPLGLEEEGPARAEAAQDIVRASTSGNEFGFGGAFEVWPPKLQSPLKASILVKHHTRRNKGRPREMIGQAIGAIAVFGEV